MMSKIIVFIVIALTSFRVFSECLLSTGEYENLGGSESYISLKFINGGDILLTTERWIPGDYESRARKSYSGKWACNSNEITLNIENKESKASVEVIGQNPMGIDENESVLYFQKSNDRLNYILTGEVFYLRK